MIDFWNEYIAADNLERNDKLKNIVDRFTEIIDSEMSKETKRHVITMLLGAYFNDLIEVLEFHRESKP